MKPSLIRDPHILQMLSLYLLLLAFFAVLISYSKSETVKSEGMAGSLGAIFRSDGNPAQTPMRQVAAEQGRIADRALLSTLGRLVETELKTGEVVSVRNGAVIRLTMPVSDVFAGGGIRVSPLGREALVTIARMVAEGSEGALYDLEFAAAGADDLTLDRAGVVARILVDSGAPVFALAAGIRNHDTDFLQFDFSRRGRAGKQQFFAGAPTP